MGPAYAEISNAENFSITKGHKVDLERAKAAIARINQIVNWTHDTKQIFNILESNPKFCLFAQEKDLIVGYAILREAGEEKHLHVSWIATDTVGRGIGSKLMHQIVAINKKLGHQFLTLTHRKENLFALRFYERIAIKESIKYMREDEDAIRYKITYEM